MYSRKISDISEYITSQNQGTCISYHTLAAYAYRKRLEWVSVFEDDALSTIVSAMCRSNRRTYGRPYSVDVGTATKDFPDARAEYHRKENGH